ncbi:MAG TPA: bifunctional glutamate N-acetyltransferase/amino-acid acetyltransferase ArgJ [Firmicutes bacterium]|nr:bifunctional glutamate N-acetyltransferase/amino-acid acetyltransferase ArgJ [Bacillota bacterium]
MSQNGVTAPMGYKAAGVHCGVKKQGKKDLALIYSEVEASAAGVFTRNKVKAAPVLLTLKNIAGGRAQAIVANSGNANACTGEVGMRDALRMAEVAAAELKLAPGMVVVASTGVIGVRLPIGEIEAGIRRAVGLLSRDGSRDAAEAILTTDTRTKEVVVDLKLGSSRVRIGGMAKGSGMIHPNMATMLSFLTTDAAIDPGILQEALRASVEKSFNMVTVDGDTSTNDMVVILANGLAGNPRITGPGRDFMEFQEALDEVTVQLARMIAGDGEGATKFVEVRVLGAPTAADARLAARAIASSNLVKTAVFGEDPNWGRIIAAAGYSGAEFDWEKVDIFIGNVKTAEGGAAVPFNEEEARNELRKHDIVLTIDLKSGDQTATAWTCDLTYDYVKINASYRS